MKISIRCRILLYRGSFWLKISLSLNRILFPIKTQYNLTNLLPKSVAPAGIFLRLEVQQWRAYMGAIEWEVWVPSPLTLGNVCKIFSYIVKIWKLPRNLCPKYRKIKMLKNSKMFTIYGKIFDLPKPNKINIKWRFMAFWKSLVNRK